MMVADTHSVLALLLVGLIAGWLAGTLVRGSGFGLIGDIVVGIVGAFVGGWLLGLVGIYIGGGMFANIVNATIGAVVLLIAIRIVRIIL